MFKWDEPVLPFNKAIIDATADLVCAYKPNMGFYMQWGAAGMIALERTIAYIPDHIPVILDCKTGDIGHTQAAWARGLFDEWDVDAITVNPYVGSEVGGADDWRSSRQGSLHVGTHIEPECLQFSG